MNILIVSEAFVGGGLETHIHTYYQELKNDHNFYFAFASFKNRLPIDTKIVDAGFHFKWESSIQEFIDDVEHLRKIIVEKKIDVIHVHPFFSMYPAMIASQLTGVPIAMTYHGIASFSFTNRIIDTIWYYYGMYELFGKIFTVSDVGKRALERQFHRNDISFLPNAVDVTQYHQHTVINNRKWAVISRLDADNGKEEALISLFKMLPDLDIDQIDIYGDGTRKEALMQYVEQHNLSKTVSFKGFQSDLFSRLDGLYNGIIGTDRVAIEGLSMGYPVLEMGYGRVIGVIDDNMMEKLRDTNFDANLMEPVPSAQVLNDMLQQVYADAMKFNMRKKIEQDFNIKQIGQKYIHDLANTPFLPHANITEFYRELCELGNKDENFWRSDTVFTLMRKNVEYYAVSSDIKILFLMHQQKMQSTEVVNNHVNGLNWRIDQVAAKIGEQVAHIASIEPVKDCRIISILKKIKRRIIRH